MDKKLLQKSFPEEIRNEIINLLESISIHSEFPIHGTFTVSLNSEKLEIPTRIYWEEHRLMEPNCLSIEQRLLLSCILTRHHNGFIRQKYLVHIIDSDFDWTIPYIIQLLGEYILEIINILDTKFDIINKRSLKQFVLNNPAYWNLTKSRVTSYWDCYYRKPNTSQVTRFLKDDYPGFKVIKKIEDLL